MAESANSSAGIKIPRRYRQKWIDGLKEITQEGSSFYKEHGETHRVYDERAASKITFLEKYLLTFLPKATALAIVRRDLFDERLEKIEGASQFVKPASNPSELQRIAAENINIKKQLESLLACEEFADDAEVHEVFKEKIKNPEFYMGPTSDESAHYLQILKRLKLSYTFVLKNVVDIATKYFNRDQKFA